MIKKKKEAKNRGKPKNTVDKKVNITDEKKPEKVEKPVKKVKKKKPVKKESEEYVFKNTTLMTILRWIIWGGLIFLFFKGVQASLRPDQAKEVERTISGFKAEFSEYKDTDTEVLSFAQNFVREYMTYKNKDEEDYKSRIKSYVSDSVYNKANLSDFNGEARVSYVRAYRKEEYAANQIDVYVLAEVDYNIQKLSEDGATFEVTKDSGQIILKVPIYQENGRYIVEDIPCFVNDDLRVENYESAEYYGTELSDTEILSEIQNSLTNFFVAYYEQEQSVINYFLTKDADQTKFVGLNGRFAFDKIENIKCYQEEGSKDIVCIVKLKIKDSINEVIMSQELNVVIQKSNQKYYIKDMDTKIVNLDID